MPSFLLKHPCEVTVLHEFIWWEDLTNVDLFLVQSLQLLNHSTVEMVALSPQRDRLKRKRGGGGGGGGKKQMADNNQIPHLCAMLPPPKTGSYSLQLHSLCEGNKNSENAL